MIVACESCNTKFRLDPERLKGPRSRVRCSRCGHVFTVTHPEEEDLVVHVDLADEFSETAGYTTAPPPPYIPPPPRKMKAGLPLKQVLVLGLSLLLLVVGVFWLVDWNGSSIDSERGKIGRKDGIQLPVSIMDTLQAYFLENAHAGQIFVVEGEVVNESPKAVSFVLVEGKLYTTNNEVAQTQRCYPGNMMTRDEVSRFSISEIQNHMMNREGRNLKNVHIPSSTRVPFMLVFHNLPELHSLNDYSVEVISAKLD